jgi:HK97 gp10 family phage protein
MLENRLPEIAAALEVEVRAAAREAAELVAADARTRVPVDTGRLRAAIHVEQTAETTEVVAGDREAWYGHIVEHGGVGHPAHPFLIPALEENREAIVALIAERVNRAVR